MHRRQEISESRAYHQPTILTNASWSRRNIDSQSLVCTSSSITGDDGWQSKGLVAAGLTLFPFQFQSFDANLLYKEESSIPHRSAHRKPTDIYSIRGGSSEGPPMHISIAPDHQNPSIKRYPKAFSSSDSSLIPFAEPKAIVVARVIEFNNSPRDDRRHVYATASETPEGEGFPRIDGRRTKDFQQRPRHKMRGSREKKAAVYPEEKKKRASVNKKTPKVVHSKGDALINGFSADHLTKDRLTVCRNTVSTNPIITDLLETTAASISSFWYIQERPSIKPSQKGL